MFEVKKVSAWLPEIFQPRFLLPIEKNQKNTKLQHPIGKKKRKKQKTTGNTRKEEFNDLIKYQKS